MKLNVNQVLNGNFGKGGYEKKRSKPNRKTNQDFDLFRSSDYHNKNKRPY